MASTNRHVPCAGFVGYSDKLVNHRIAGPRISVWYDSVCPTDFGLDKFATV